MLTSSTGTNYVLNEHEDLDQYDSFAIPSKIMPCCNYPANLGNQNEIPVLTSYCVKLTSSSGTNYVHNQHNIDRYSLLLIELKKVDFVSASMS